MTSALRSDHIVLEPINSGRVDELHAIFVDPHVRKFLWDDEVIPREQTAEIIKKNEELFRDGGFGIWGITQLGSKELVGFAGYWYFRDPPILELLFGVAPVTGTAASQQVREICWCDTPSSRSE